jgi:hypothetical protein
MFTLILTSGMKSAGMQVNLKESVSRNDHSLNSKFGALSGYIRRGPNSNTVVL